MKENIKTNFIIVLVLFLGCVSFVNLWSDESIAVPDAIEETAAETVPVFVIVLFGGSGLLFAGIGIGFLVSYIGRRRIIKDAQAGGTTQMVSGTLVDWSYDESRSFSKTKITFYPIYEYEINGEKRTYIPKTTDTFLTMNGKRNISNAMIERYTRRNLGKKVTIYIDEQGNALEGKESFQYLFIAVVFTLLGCMATGIATSIAFSQYM